VRGGLGATVTINAGSVARSCLARMHARYPSYSRLSRTFVLLFFRRMRFSGLISTAPPFSQRTDMLALPRLACFATPRYGTHVADCALEVRLGFVRKVFSIVAAQLLCTIAVTAAVFMSPTLRTFVQERQAASLPHKGGPRSPTTHCEQITLPLLLTSAWSLVNSRLLHTSLFVVTFPTGPCLVSSCLVGTKQMLTHPELVHVFVCGCVCNTALSAVTPHTGSSGCRTHPSSSSHFQSSFPSLLFLVGCLWVFCFHNLALFGQLDAHPSV
jgi:hypothetical protein